MRDLLKSTGCILERVILMGTNDTTGTRHSISRRGFLHGTAATTLTAVAASRLSTHAYAAGDDEIKIALIGCGGRGTGAAVQALSTQGRVTLWAMADAFPDRLEASHKQLVDGGHFSRSPDAGSQAAKVDVPPERRFSGLDAYRKVMALDEVDVVIQATPPAFRPIHFEAAIQAGKHVFMEKPVATDAPGIRKVLAAAKEADRKGLKVGVGLNRRHSHIYQEMLRRVHDGAVGRINALRIYNVRSGSGKYHKRQPQETELEYQVRHWYFFTWLSGDFIVEQSVHDFDVACWMKGQHPIAAQGQGGRLVRTGNDYGDIFDHFYVEYDFPDGSKLLSQHRHMPHCWSHIAQYADGASGTASVVSKRKGTIQLHDREEPLWRGGDEGNSYQTEHDRLFDAIRNDRPHNEAEYGAESTMTAVLGRMAACSGKMITWEDAINSEKELTTNADTWDAPAPVQPKTEGGYEIPIPGLTKVL
jgi:myo-inositol 2-dehydrogenase / D-chiro-inositol 1-dehydrogenase